MLYRIYAKADRGHCPHCGGTGKYRHCEHCAEGVCSACDGEGVRYVTIAIDIDAESLLSSGMVKKVTEEPWRGAWRKRIT